MLISRYGVDPKQDLDHVRKAVKSILVSHAQVLKTANAHASSLRALSEALGCFSWSSGVVDQGLLFLELLSKFLLDPSIDRLAIAYARSAQIQLEYVSLVLCSRLIVRLSK